MSMKRKVAHSLKHIQCLAQSDNGRANRSAELEVLANAPFNDSTEQY